MDLRKRTGRIIRRLHPTSVDKDLHHALIRDDSRPSVTGARTDPPGTLADERRLYQNESTRLANERSALQSQIAHLALEAVRDPTNAVVLEKYRRAKEAVEVIRLQEELYQNAATELSRQEYQARRTTDQPQ